MKKTIILIDDKRKERACVVIRGLKEKLTHEVVIRPHKETLSSRQRRFYWEWITNIAGEIGYTKEELHHEYKGRFLVPIFYRDPDYAELVDCLGSGNSGPMMQIVKLTSITRANTKQMWEYMTDIEHNATDLGIS